jgi:hypothetical protein
MSRYTGGIMSDGAAILEHGCPVPIEEVVRRLNKLNKIQDALALLHSVGAERGDDA